jgi:hypothetical protein
VKPASNPTAPTEEFDEFVSQDVDWSELRPVLEGLSTETQTKLAAWLAGGPVDKLMIERAMLLKPSQPQEDAAAVKEACRPDISKVTSPDYELDREEIDNLLRDSGPEKDPWDDLLPRQKAFLLSYLHHGSILSASRGVCHMTSHFLWLETSLDYARAFGHACCLKRDILFEQALNLATVGERVPSYHQGRPVLSNFEHRQIFVTKRSDKLFTFLLKNYTDFHPPTAPSMDELRA